MGVALFIIIIIFVQTSESCAMPANYSYIGIDSGVVIVQGIIVWLPGFCCCTNFVVLSTPTKFIIND